MQPVPVAVLNKDIVIPRDRGTCSRIKQWYAEVATVINTVAEKLKNKAIQSEGARNNNAEQIPLPNMLITVNDFELILCLSLAGMKLPRTASNATINRM
jgi:hypothetical protein